MRAEVVDERTAPTSSSQVTDLVDANHILFDQGVLDAFGHVSVRTSHDPERFLLARNLAPALVQEDDILEFNLDGETSDSRAVYLERFIHSEIYKARPDVMAVVHSHSPAVVPFGVVDLPLAGRIAYGWLPGAAHIGIRNTGHFRFRNGSAHPQLRIRLRIGRVPRPGSRHLDARSWLRCGRRFTPERRLSRRLHRDQCQDPSRRAPSWSLHVPDRRRRCDRCENDELSK